jgi:outer membrane lipoprotein-sorting protein
MSVMGMEMPMEIWMKNPNKIKTVMDMGGQQMIQAFDGEKGYQINPMAGSATPVEMTSQELQQLMRSNTFENNLANYLKQGKLTYLGEETVNGNAAFKIKATLDEGLVSTVFLDKSNYHVVKTNVDVTQGGMPVTIESFPSDYNETNGVILPMKTTTSMSGMEMVMTITNVEVDVPMDDGLFKLK